MALRSIKRSYLTAAASKFKQCSDSTSPSKVLHFRNLSQDVMENDLVTLVRKFGTVQHVVLLRTWNQAFLEMQSPAASSRVLKHFNRRQACLKGRNIYIQYSSRSDLTKSPPHESYPLLVGILFVTILKPFKPITLDVLHKVFSRHGQVKKIVICQQSSVLHQAFVQYDSQKSAARAKRALNGREIYEGCCHMEIQYSKTDDLRVKFNNDRTRDFTDDTLPPSANASILGPSPSDGLARRCTLLLSNLNQERINERKLFNLFSCYGVVMRIRMFGNNALVEMKDDCQAQFALICLQGTQIYGKSLEVAFSKHCHVRHPKMRDYSDTTKNRFSLDAVNNCSPPTKILHVANLPSGITEAGITNHLHSHGLIRELKILEGRRQALVEYESKELATHILLRRQAEFLNGRRVRLSFSSGCLWKHRSEG